MDHDVLVVAIVAIAIVAMVAIVFHRPLMLKLRRAELRIGGRATSPTDRKRRP
jgi:hypothetical protein